MSAVLESAGSSLDLVNKVNIFLVEPSDFTPMNEVYVTFFKDPKPVCRDKIYFESELTLAGENMCLRESFASWY